MAWGIVLALAFVFAASIFLEATRSSPLGDTDAMAMWNLRAVFLSRTGGDWSTFARPEIAHGDYPPLLPFLVARTWSIAGGEMDWIPACLSAGFLIANVGILTGALASRCGFVFAACGAVLFCSAPAFVRHAASQSADLPVGTFLVAALVVRNLPGARARILAGLLLGCAGFTKNEGLAMCASALAAELVFERGRSIANLSPLCAGMMFPLSAWAYYRSGLSVGTDLVDLQTRHDLLAKLCDASRYRVVLSAWLERCVKFGSERPLNGSSPALIMALWLLQRLLVKRTKFSAAPYARSLVVVATLGVVYGFVFVLTPRDQEWHIATAMTRTMFQLWPAFVLTCVGSLRSPT